MTDTLVMSTKNGENLILNNLGLNISLLLHIAPETENVITNLIIQGEANQIMKLDFGGYHSAKRFC